MERRGEGKWCLSLSFLFRRAVAQVELILKTLAGIKVVHPREELLCLWISGMELLR